jgi:hypothetical protein
VKDRCRAGLTREYTFEQLFVERGRPIAIRSGNSVPTGQLDPSRPNGWYGRITLNSGLDRNDTLTAPMCQERKSRLRRLGKSAALPWWCPTRVFLISAAGRIARSSAMGSPSTNF